MTVSIYRELWMHSRSFQRGKWLARMEESIHKTRWKKNMSFTNNVEPIATERCEVKSLSHIFYELMNYIEC